MPYFSVIIPTYNRSQYLKAAIQSVIDQDFLDWELIIVDDGSTDDTKTVVESFANSKIKYIYQENAERGAARNKGVKNASGKYVFFLDSDDVIYKDHLENAFQKLNNLGEPEFFHSRYEEVFPSGKRSVPPLNKDNLLKKVFKRNRFACQFFLRKDIADKIPFSENRDLKIGEDWEVVLKIAVRYPLHFSNHVSSAIIQHEDRSMSIASSDTIERSRDILIDELSKDKLITPEIRANVFAELTSLSALAHAMNGDRKNAFKIWNESVKEKGGIFFSRRSLAIYKKIIFGGKA